MRVRIEILYVSSNTKIGTGFVDISEFSEYDGLKILITDAINGKVSFMKFVDDCNNDFYLSGEVLRNCKITLCLEDT